MTRREVVHAAAYGAAFAEEMARLDHGGRALVRNPDGVIVETTIDARAKAHAWAKQVADAAVEGSDEA